MKNYRIIKGKKIHVNQLAANSRKFTVSNNTIHKLGLNNKNVVTIWHEVRTTKFDTPVYGKTFEVDKDGKYHLIERKFDPTPLILNHKQPKRLIKCKKRKYSDWKSYSNQHGEKELKREKRNDFLKYFHNYPYTIKPLTKEAYWEKLVEHKLEKWERKNPMPEEMFVEEVEKWKQLRENMKMHFRDFVVSIYDKLNLIGRFKISDGNYKEEVVATIKDINGEGHNVNNLGKSSKLLKKAQQVTNTIHAKRCDLVSTNLKDHKRKKGRILLPSDLMMMRKAA